MAASSQLTLELSDFLTSQCAGGPEQRDVRYWQILLQKLFWGVSASNIDSRSAVDAQR
jgi:hypothetical protein